MAEIAFNVFAQMKAKQGMQDRVRAALERMIEPTTQEEANAGYALHQGKEDPNVFILYEGWASEEGFKQHTQAPHFKQLQQDLDGALDGPLQITLANHVNGPVPGAA